MPPDSAWTDSFNKSDIKLRSAGIGWKNFMKECLMETEVLKKNEQEKFLHVNPNLAMDMRHSMVKQSAKIIPISQVVIHTEALKLLRLENHSRLLRQKEGKMVEKEIAKLKQVLENHRLFIKKRINETTSKKSKYPSNSQPFLKCTKFWKILEHHDRINEVGNSQNQCVQMRLESKISQNTVCKSKLFFKNKESVDDFSEPVSTRKGSIIDENEFEDKKLFWEENEDKNEIVKKFFAKNETQEKHDLQSSIKEVKKIRDFSEIQNLVNHKRIERAWETWKAYAQKLKSRKREKANYKIKIEEFMMKLKEKKSKQTGSVKSFKENIKANLNPKNIRINWEKHTYADEKEERLKKIIQDLKTSQTETCEKLQEITKKRVENQENPLNTQFLKRMEERREERLKRRKEIEEKKRRIEEEKEEIKREKEKEKKQQEEENKRKSLEEFKEKQRLEKERREKQRKEKEKLKLNMRLAENHYETYLLRSYGLRPWGALLKLRQSQKQHALKFSESRLKKKVFHNWTANIREQLEFKAMRAGKFYEKVLKRKYFHTWMELLKENMRQNQVAIDWNEFKVTERAFKIWLNVTQDERMNYLDKKDAAKLNYERKLKEKCLAKLKDYPEFKKLEQARENRKRKWRQKVKEILPDYRPLDISERF